MKAIIGEQVGGACYPIYVGDKRKHFPIGYAVKVKGGWVGIRHTHAFARPTRKAVIESLILADMAEKKRL